MEEVVVGVKVGVKVVVAIQVRVTGVEMGGVNRKRCVRRRLGMFRLRSRRTTRGLV